MLTYLKKRGQLETYFDRTAVEAWKQLTSDAPVSGIRATVRAGRGQTRAMLLGWLPADLRGKRILDAGCGTGALAVEAARRGADVTAIDLSPKLVAIARERLPHNLGLGRIEFLSGDMLDPGLGEFDHIISMDSLIHYQSADVVRALASLSLRAKHSILFTFAPGSLALSAMLAMGRLFPRSDRSPVIQPTPVAKLSRLIEGEPQLATWRIARTQRISSGFYISQPLELLRQ